MTPNRPTPGGRDAAKRREALREMREELERVRRAEARIAEALGSLRAARQRVEELSGNLSLEEDVVREIVREELSAAGEGGEAPVTSALFAGVGAPEAVDHVRDDVDDEGGLDEESPRRRAAATPPPPTVVEARRSFWVVGVAAVSVLVVAVVAWLAVQAFRTGTEPQTLTLGGDSTAPADSSAGAAALSGGTPQPDEAERFFVLLPADPALRAAVYDSLWTARSGLFEPVLAVVEGATGEGTVERAAEAWRDGSATPLQLDLLHSALVQWALGQEMGSELELDGQLLRNPCRGASCSALLNFWETRGDSYALPQVPEDAPRNTEALRVVENVLVLNALERHHVAAATPPSEE